MRIGINILYLVPGKVGGTETYAKGLIQNYINSKSDEFYIYCIPEALKVLPINERLKYITVKGLNSRFYRILYEQLILPFVIYKHKIKVLHSLGYTSPFITHCPKVTTVHDLNWYYHPEDFSIFEKFAWEVLVRLSVISSQLVVAVSEASKDSLIKVLHVPSSKVKAVLSGIPTIKRRNNSNNKRSIDNYKLPKQYILTVSAGYPHKNLRTALEAFKILVGKNPNLFLIICGLKGKADDENWQYVYNSCLQNRVKILGYVSDEELGVLYKNAQVFIFTSAYEGFGFPVLESLVHNVPVISSNSFSLKELINTSDGLVEPYDIMGFARKINQVLHNPRFKQRLLASEKIILKKLSWRLTANIMLKYIHKLSHQ